jgi:DNA-binding transcriptional ArsR family regulator
VTDPLPDCVPVEGVLQALADPTRRQVLDLVVARGAATATEIAAELPVSRQAVAHHLGVLEGVGVVEASRVGREVLFRPRPDALRATGAWLVEVATSWERRLDRIRRIAEAEPDPRD